MSRCIATAWSHFAQDGALFADLNLDAEMFEELLPVDTFFGDYLDGLHEQGPPPAGQVQCFPKFPACDAPSHARHVIKFLHVSQDHNHQFGMTLGNPVSNAPLDQSIAAPREGGASVSGVGSGADGSAPRGGVRPASAYSGDSDALGDDDGKRGKGKGGRKGKGSRYRTPRQQLLNRQAQQRYRERQKAKNESMESRIQALMEQVQRLEAVDRENQELHRQVEVRAKG